MAVLLAFPIHGTVRAAEHPASPDEVVNYEAFGAVGDGKTDDLPAIRDAHAHANQHGQRVRSKPGAIYHLGRRAITVIIATDTDWGTSRFIIDDSHGVENHAQPLFEVRSLLKPVPQKIERLARGQMRLDVRPAGDCLVFVENDKRRIFIRRGLNQNNGTSQKEVFILHRDGTIEGGIDWDYDIITNFEARPIDTQPLVLHGGIFTNIANRMEQEDRRSGYWSRNILIRRSNTVVDGITHHVTGETDVGQPYQGFLSASKSARVIFRDCVIDGRKTYIKKAGSAGKPVPMGTYGYSASLVVDFRMIGCRTGNDIHDRSRWGVMGTNFIKNFLVENCTLSRVDVHQGVSGSYIIRRSTLGHAGLNAIGRGSLIVEDSTLHGGHLISFRQDYGSTWDGEVIIRNCRWMPPAGKHTRSVMFGMNNDGMHDFGYPCSMPRVIRIDGLSVDDSGRSAGYQGIDFLGDPIGPSREKRPFPYRLTEKLEIRALKTSSGLPPRVSNNPEVARAVTVIHE